MSRALDRTVAVARSERDPALGTHRHAAMWAGFVAAFAALVTATMAPPPLG
jgi:hypothetical protein